MNVYGELTEVCVDVAGDDVISYEVTPVPAVHVMGTLVPDTVPAVTLVGAADVYMFPDVTGELYAPIEFWDEIVNVYCVAAVSPVNVYAVPDVV